MLSMVGIWECWMTQPMPYFFGAGVEFITETLWEELVECDPMRSYFLCYYHMTC